MTAEPMTLKYHRLRVPKQNGQLLQIPPLDEFESIWQENLAQWSTHQFNVNGQDIHCIRESAQRELVAKSVAYTSRYRNVGSISDEGHIVLAGHQPTLFHPGVWYKNFALSQLARRAACVGINIVIDNDLCTACQIRVPAGTPHNARIENVNYDSIDQFVPFEMVSTRDRQAWKLFGDRVSTTISAFVGDPLIDQLWPLVMSVSREGLESGYAIAAGRHRLESKFGLQTLEIPLSQICDTQSFADFLAEMINRADQLHDIYNRSLVQYRTLHRIRSHSHPVPELAKIDGWTELPFWIWRDVNKTRRRLFMARRGTSIRLADAGDWELTINGASIAEQLVNLRNVGVYIRPRALMTTMYARLVLGQLFLHGIGGAKYDQLTDLIVHGLFGVGVPSFLTLTSTNRLPTGETSVESADLSHIQVNLRSLVYHPESYVDASENGAAELIERKQSLIDSMPTSGSKRAWHCEIEAVNHAFQPLVESNRQLVLEEQVRLQRAYANHRILGSREFSFCLFPASLVEQLNS